ncbi:MAG: glycosyl transferase [Magnetococcales bacterium]|nr:glycosyl transferase [Magnetococcales bacterium]
MHWDAMMERAAALAAAGEPEPLAVLYREWREAGSDPALAYLGHYNFGVHLMTVGDSPGARAAFEEAIRLHPDCYPAYINLGTVLAGMGEREAAVARWLEMTERLSGVTSETINYKNTALKQMGRVLKWEGAERALRGCLELDPRQPDALVHWLSWRQEQWKWPVIAPFPGCDHAHLLRGFSPIALQGYSDDPMLLLAHARHYFQESVGQAGRHFLDAHAALRRAPAARPRVGYLSSDLRYHAVGFLTVEVFELHDRERFEIFVYDCGPPPEDPIRLRVRAAAEHWLDVAAWSDEALAERIVADGIELLIDLNGYTQHARTRMLTMRPAPVIVNWLGFAGSMASPCHDYLIADPFVIPPEHEIFYSEKVLRLPCYQPNNRHRGMSGHLPTRRDLGLPEGVMVYGCFNGVRKITSQTWEPWSRILSLVPESVLWLLEENDWAKRRVRELAAAQGIDPARIHFAPMVPNHEHLARYPLMDLMLDTFPYGAHTTASDGLWMGVPVVTRPGLAFASRVCGSLLTAAGLPELVCASEEEYVARAVELGTHPERLTALRERLRATRDGSVLFDTPALVHHLEGLFDQMVAAWRADAVPRPDPANLDHYLEIGCDLDREGVRFLTLAALREGYQERLRARDRLAMIRDDSRLWNQAARASHRPDLQLMVRRLDEADDQDGLRAFLAEPGHDPMEMIYSIAELLPRLRLRSAFPLAVKVADAGYWNPVVAVALAAGGLLFGNPGEERRGVDAWRARIAEVPEPARTRILLDIVVPVRDFLMRSEAGRAHPERTAALFGM